LIDKKEDKTMRIMALGLAAAMAVSVAGCETNQQTGTLVGAGTGALIGASLGRGTSGRLLGAGIGAALGAIVGSEIGRRLDERDRQMYAQTATYAAESAPVGQPQEWSNPQSGNRGTVTATTAAYRGGDGRQCRNFSETITLKDGKTETVNGRRCKNADGSWEFVG
jgi:surface antigen